MSSEFEIVLDYPHLVNPNDSTVIENAESIKRILIFKRDDIVTIKVTNVEVDFAYRGNFALKNIYIFYNEKCLYF